MGIIGYGRIGKATARLAQAFGMQVLAYTPEQIWQPEFTSLVDLETVFRESDVVSLHCPLTSNNVEMVNAEKLKLMKPTAFLINTSRGGLIDENALAESLNSDRLAGAGLDVLSIEPPIVESPLFTAKNCFVTPHIAWATRASRQRLLDTVVENVAAFLRGELRNVVY